MARERFIRKYHQKNCSFYCRHWLTRLRSTSWSSSCSRRLWRNLKGKSSIWEWTRSWWLRSARACRWSSPPELLRCLPAHRQKTISHESAGYSDVRARHLRCRGSSLRGRWRRRSNPGRRFRRFCSTLRWRWPSAACSTRTRWWDWCLQKKELRGRGRVPRSTHWRVVKLTVAGLAPAADDRWSGDKVSRVDCGEVHGLHVTCRQNMHRRVDSARW